MPPAIRPATLDDVPAILALEQQAASAAHWSFHAYEKLVKEAVVLVAEEACRICGFVCASDVAGEWEIENVVVAAGFLRRGVADQLVLSLLAQAERRAAS